MRMLKHVAASAIGSVILIAAAPASATTTVPLTFAMTSATDSAVNGNVANASSAVWGNGTTSSGVSATVTAWNATYNASAGKYLVSSAYLGTYTYGMGVTSATNDNPQISGYCSNPGDCYTHQIDNMGSTAGSSSVDFIQVQFSQVVTLSALTRVSFGTVNSTMNGLVYDDDFSYGNGLKSDGTAAAALVSGASYASLAPYISVNSPDVVNGSATCAPTSGLCTDTSTLNVLAASKTWFISASLAANYGGDGNVDSFKVKSLAVNYTAPGAVPEPASWATMVLGFGVVGGAIRRRNASARAALAA